MWYCFPTSNVGVPFEKSINKDGQPKQHREPERRYQVSGPSKVQSNLLPKVVPYPP